MKPNSNINKKSKEEILNNVVEDVFPATADEVFYDGQPHYVLRAMQAHTTQTLDRLKEGVKELKDNACVTTIEGHRNRHNAFCEVLKLIEEVSDG